MALHNIDIEAGMRRLAEQRIEDAMREGKFSNLPGMGRPLDLEPIPAGENARLTWWALRILKQNDYTPEEVRWLKQVELLKAELAAAQTEVRVRVIVKTLNALVHRINTLGTNVINASVAPVDLETELRRVRTADAGRRE